MRAVLQLFSTPVPADVTIVWNQNLWGVDNWSILAGTPNADA